MVIPIILEHDENGILQNPEGQAHNRAGQLLDDVGNVIPNTVVVDENADYARFVRQRTLGDYRSLIISMSTGLRLDLHHSRGITLS